MTNHPVQRITVYKIACFKAMVSTYVINGFKITGVYFFNKNVFPQDEVLQSYVTDQPLTPDSSNTATGEPNIFAPEDIQPFPKVSIPKTEKS